jgi:hypothetical protein
MIKVLDNILSPTFADLLELEARTHLQYSYDEETSQVWDANQVNILKDKNTRDCGQFFCCIHIKDTPKQELHYGEYFETLKPIICHLQDALREEKYRVTDILRIKTNLLLREKDFKKNQYNIPHVDSILNEKNVDFTMLYYLSDSDGDTFFFDQHYTEGKHPGKLTVAQRVTPKKNRAVIFDSTRYHASSNPSINKTRLVINFMVKTEKLE